LEEKRFLVLNLLIIFSGLILSLIILIPLSIKWELETKITIPAACLIGIISGVIVNAFVINWNITFFHILIGEGFIIIFFSTLLILWRFYRDPERISPVGDHIVVSPADGKIVYVKKYEKGKIPYTQKNGRKYSLIDFIQADALPESGTLIGIGMSFLDVHINRAPISGTISLFKYIKGAFISLKKKEAVIQNERAMMVMENKNIKIGIVLIASRLVRKIVPFIQEGQEAMKGVRIGMIRFGSQVDVIIPDQPSVQIKVKTGEIVKAGLTIIAQLNN
jgi:phosphatidylserine decarboxylase